MKEAVRFVTVHLQTAKLSRSIAYDASSIFLPYCWLLVVLFEIHSKAVL